MSMPKPKKPLTLPDENKRNANEYREALQFNSSLRQRRQSLEHADDLHMSIPRRMGSVPTKQDFEKIIKNGGIECHDLFGLLMLGSEVDWLPEVKRAAQSSSSAQQPSPNAQSVQASPKLSGRDQIRTGRKFLMLGASGEKICVRIHTQDHTQDEKSTNAGKGCIVRIEFGKDHLLSERDTFKANAITPASNSFWSKNLGGVKINLAHIPLRFNQVDLKRSTAAQSPMPGMGKSASFSTPPKSL